MARPPAICNDCGSIFPSAFMVGGAGNFNVRFEGCLSGPCPICGGMGRIPDGVYNFIGNTIALLSGPARKISELNKLEKILIKSKKSNVTAGEVGEAIKKELPELSSIGDILPKTKNELYAFLVILLTILSMIIPILKDDKRPNIIINQVINNVYKQSSSNAIVKKSGAKIRTNNNAHATKVGRNDPCPCGSGKKLKKCHGK